MHKRIMTKCDAGPSATPRASLPVLREELGLLQSDIAKRSGGLDQSRVSRIETGEDRLTVARTLRCAARGYGLSVASFEKLCAGKLSAKQAAAIVRRAEKADKETNDDL